MSDILGKILEQKRAEVQALRRRASRDGLRDRAANQSAVRGFGRALSAKTAARGAAVIAEIKRASPSRGLIREDFDPAALSADYAQGGATCLSVLTDQNFFQGSAEHLQQARDASVLPVLRKDFIIDEWQVSETRALGADAMLLIVAALSNSQMSELAAAAAEQKLDVLVEIHDRPELERFLKSGLPAGTLLGINNRNLRTFETRLETTLELLPELPAGLPVVTESGIGTPADVQRMRGAGVHRFLIGESLLREPSPGEALRKLLTEKGDSPSF